MILKDRHLVIIEVIKAESQLVLNTFTEHDFQDAFKKNVLEIMNGSLCMQFQRM
jgi:hypothetical protein